MSEETAKKPNFDPITLEQVDVNKDYPMEPDEFEILYKHNCYCHMAHISQYGYPIVTPMFYVVLVDSGEGRGVHQSLWDVWRNQWNATSATSHLICYPSSKVPFTQTVT